jgi:hypothetical protein
MKEHAGGRRLASLATVHDQLLPPGDQERQAEEIRSL